MIRRIAIVCLAFILPVLAPSWSAAGETVNRVVAVVGDELITSNDVDRMVANIKTTLSQPRDPALAARQAAEIRGLALKRLIEDKLVAKEAKRLRIKISDAEIDSYLQRIKKQNNISDQEFAAQLSRQGFTPEEYREDLRSDMLRHRLVDRQVRRKVVVSDEQVDEYLRKEGLQGESGDQVRMRAIFLKIPESASDTAQKAMKVRLQAIREQALKGGDMAKLAREHSQGPGAAQGGQLGPVALADLLPGMRNALSGLKPGQFSKIFTVPGSLAFVQLLERSHGASQPLTSRREEVRTMLEKEAMEKKLAEWIKEIKQGTYVKIIK